MPRFLVPVLLATACAAAPDGGGAGGPLPLGFPLDGSAGGKSDLFGRRLAGVAAPFVPRALDERRMRADARYRREQAWETARQVLESVPLLGLAEGTAAQDVIELPEGEVPRVPRFQTWYGVDDFVRLFQYLYEGLGPAGRAARAPFTEEAIDEAFAWNATALDRSSRWPLERYLDQLRRLGLCPEETPADDCARAIQSGFAGATAGITRVAYSPGAVRHVLRSYPRILDCLDHLDEAGVDAPAPSTDNFTLCFAGEMPDDAVVLKAHWARADGGDRDIPVYDTDAAALARRLGGSATWGESGDRRADPGPDAVYTIRLRDGSVYRLLGLHIMTKELRHWSWITLFYSDRPDHDLGADRPTSFRRAVDPVFRSYKLCAVSWYEEEDGTPTWCSNPYIEQGWFNAATNCIGCHQHGGATVAHDLDGDGALDPFYPGDVLGDELLYPGNGRARIRELFVDDYLYALGSGDALADIIASEAAYFDRAD